MTPRHPTPTTTRLRLRAARPHPPPENSSSSHATRPDDKVVLDGLDLGRRTRSCLVGASGPASRRSSRRSTCWYRSIPADRPMVRRSPTRRSTPTRWAKMATSSSRSTCSRMTVTITSPPAEGARLEAGSGGEGEELARFGRADNAISILNGWRSSSGWRSSALPPGRSCCSMRSHPPDLVPWERSWLIQELGHRDPLRHPRDGLRPGDCRPGGVPPRGEGVGGGSASRALHLSPEARDSGVPPPHHRSRTALTSGIRGVIPSTEAGW